MSVVPPRPTMTKKPSQTQMTPAEESWEDHLVIRFPPDIAGKVEKFVSEEAHANDRLSVMFDEDLRGGSVRFDDRTMPFRVYDLPTITEVMKTVDKKTVYKVADLSQIIVCSALGGSEMRIHDGHDDERNGRRPLLGGTKWPHGLCPPMKNARKKKFRKVKRKKFFDQTDVERELKRILRADLEAQAVRWEIVDCKEGEEPPPLPPSNRGERVVGGGGEDAEQAGSSRKTTAEESSSKNEAHDSSKSDLDAALWDLDDSLSLSESSEEEREAGDDGEESTQQGTND